MERCAHAGCQGSVEEGYCTACGLAPSRLPPPVVKAVTITVSAPSAVSVLSGRGSKRSASRRLGAQVLARPPLPRRDPLAALVPFEVPVRRRVCSSCEQPLSREAGFCPRCGQEYSFVPTLSPGDRVADKYEIKGTVAFGGLGWIYLALDTVLGRWVILKGLLDANDPKMLEVAVQEREYLAAVKHPNIVGIHDFVTRGSGRTEGFIVLEYVNGKTLMTLRKEAGGPLPPAQACAYICEVLPALGYLDDLGLVYCDFKPENVMVEGETVKLIDLGAVRPAGALDGDVYGSLGYIAPEAHEAPTSRSDLYSVGRALAVLVASFDFQGRYSDSLPPPSEVPLFAQEDALHRFLLKATRANPDERFQSAAEMRGQLLGVMRGLASKDERGAGVAGRQRALRRGRRAGRPGRWVSSRAGRPRRRGGGDRPRSRGARRSGAAPLDVRARRRGDARVGGAEAAPARRADHPRAIPARRGSAGDPRRRPMRPTGGWAGTAGGCASSRSGPPRRWRPSSASPPTSPASSRRATCSV